MPPKGGLSIKNIQLEHSCVLALSFEALLYLGILYILGCVLASGLPGTRVLSLCTGYPYSTGTGYRIQSSTG